MNGESKLEIIEEEINNAELSTKPLSQSDKAEMLDALDGLRNLREQYEKTFQKWLSADETYNDLLQESPEYLFSPEAMQYAENMKKAEAFEKKARGIQSEIEKIDSRLREKLAAEGITDKDLADDVHAMTVQTGRAMKAYRNTEEYCEKAFEQIENMYQMRNDELMAERDLLMAEYKRLKKAGRL